MDREALDRLSRDELLEQLAEQARGDRASARSAGRTRGGDRAATESHLVQGKERFLAAAADDLDE
jgi:hypothetical protein